MAQTASPLDQPQVAAYIKSALKGDRKPSEIVHGLDVSYGITTTKDSIRRFRERHNIKNPKKKAAKSTKAAAPKKTQPAKPAFQYSIIEQDGEQCITVFAPGETPKVADSSHPNFSAMVEKAKAGDIAVLDLFDVEKVIRENFTRLSERVLVRNGRIYFDGNELDNAITEHILRFLDEGGATGDWSPLVNFLEKIQDNPIEHSREQLYRWLASHKFSITQEGDIVAYKGVKRIENEAAEHDFQSVYGGHAIVDEVEVHGEVPQSIGSVVEMPRTEVAHNPREACSSGLHVATFSYAKGWGEVVLEVHVNPRDIVSVPNGEAEKARTCRYYVEDVVTAPYEAAIVLDTTPAPVPAQEADECLHCACFDAGDQCCVCGE
jgi:hypothetical protein